MEAFCSIVPKSKAADSSPLTPSGQTQASSSLEKMGRKILSAPQTEQKIQSQRGLRPRNTGRSAGGSQDFTARGKAGNVVAISTGAYPTS